MTQQRFLIPFRILKIWTTVVCLATLAKFKINALIIRVSSSLHLLICMHLISKMKSRDHVLVQARDITLKFLWWTLKANMS